MTRSNRLLLLFSLALLAGAIAFDRFYKESYLLKNYADQISSYIAENETVAQQIIQTDGSWMKGIVESQKAPSIDPAASGERFEKYNTLDFTLLLLKGDSIVFWSNNKAIPTPKTQIPYQKYYSNRFVKLSFGEYYERSWPLDDYTIKALIPIKYSVRVDYDRPRYAYPADAGIDENLEVSLTESPYPVKNRDGAVVCFLNPNKNAKFVAAERYKFFFYFAFMLVFFTWVNNTSREIAEKYKTAWASIFLLSVVGGLIGIMQYLDFTGRFSDLYLFSRNFDRTMLGKSLGDWLLHIGILLWLMVFFHREFQVKAFGNLPFGARLTLGFMYYLSMMMSILISIEMFRQLVFLSGINFDFDNILNLDRYSLLAIMGIILLLAALFLFSHRMMQTISRIELSRLSRVISLSLASIVTYLVGVNFELEISGFYIMSFSLIYVILFDYFIDWKAPGFGWIVCWLIIFSLFSALLLYKYNSIRDNGQRVECAEKLIEPADSCAEASMARLHEVLSHDSVLNKQIMPFPLPTNANAIKDHIRYAIFAENYLFQHYNFETYLFDKNKACLSANSEVNFDSLLVRDWEKIGKDSSTWLRIEKNGRVQYLLKTEVLRSNIPSEKVDLYCLFEREQPKSTKVYSELFYNQPYKGLKSLHKFDYAIFRNNILVENDGRINEFLYNPVTFPGPGRFANKSSDNDSRQDFMITSTDGKTTVVVGKQTGGIMKQVYLFSSLFSLLSFFMMALAGFNSWVRILPDYYQFYISTKGSLAKRIQYYTVALIVSSFIIIGIMTYRNFTESSQKNENTKLEYSTNSMLKHLSLDLSDTAKMNRIRKQNLGVVLEPLSKSFSMDVNLYSTEGELIYTSQKDLSSLGLISSKMSSKAYHELARQSVRSTIEQEKLGGVEFSMQYMALTSKDQKNVVAFLGVPYVIAGNNLNTEVSDFLGKLSSLYVFLLLLAGTVAISLARTIIKPIELIGDKIRQLRFEDKNEPLQYQGDGRDELSELIEEYNRMVEKLEDSKTKLIRFEREGAWREMARQVAHEIKNPLTTMKLSMQMLERISSDPEQAREYLKKAIRRLIEQIDSLAQIATEFSMFARMEIKDKYDLVLNEVVESVWDLFRETEGVDFNLNLPKEQFHIHGDKNHLMRVFNNLIINATQAIPSDRQGSIRVVLYREGNYAVVRVSDNGAGIPKEIQDRVFEPNFTTKTSGSGLGLAICKKIIEAHEGDITFETRENDGTDFYVIMPITVVETGVEVSKTRVDHGG